MGSRCPTGGKQDLVGNDTASNTKPPLPHWMAALCLRWDPPPKPHVVPLTGVNESEKSHTLCYRDYFR